MRYFSVTEANEMLPKLKPLMADLLAMRARVVRSRHELGPMLDDLISDVGGRTASEMVLDFMEIERLVEKVQSYGCVIKDLNAGLLDFPSQRNGRDIYLCWRYGEEEITHFHNLNAGFQGRQPV